ncbi:MAG TPA: hypothetical protein VEC38_14770 [Candidatus Binataceae bacterium]|nr:hypothetical protein [Candidatus Binataceae bacterium]
MNIDRLTVHRRRRMRSVAVFAMIAAALCAIAAISPASAAAGWTPGPSRALKGAAGVYEWRFDAIVGKPPFNRIALHRIATGPKPPEHPALVLLYLPGTNMNGEVAIDDAHYWFPIYLAAHGADVWALDYRTHFVPPTASESELSELKDWTDDRFESDIAAAADLVMSTTHRGALFVAGFSRGVDFAYLFAAMHPAKVQGIVAFDGFFSPEHPMRTGAPERVADDIGGPHLTYDKRRFLMQAVIDNPDGPAPIPKYKTARENLEHVLYDARQFGGQGGESNALGGVSDATVLARLLIAYDRYWPAVQDYENPFTPALVAALRASKIPVIAFSSTNIKPEWPSLVEQSAHSTGSDDVTFKKFPGWGHIDVLCSKQSEAEVYAPLAEWLKRHQK